MNSFRIFTYACLLLLCYSCNTSFSLLNRRYRPGYTVAWSGGTAEPKKKLPETVAVEAKAMDTDLTAYAAAAPESIQVFQAHGASGTTSNELAPSKEIRFKRKLDHPFQEKRKQIHERKKRTTTIKEEEPANAKPMEPFNLVACFLVCAGILLGVILHATGPLAILIFLLTLGLVFLFTMISKRRMVRYPDRYSKVSNVLNTIFFILGMIVFVIFWILLRMIWLSE